MAVVRRLSYGIDKRVMAILAILHFDAYLKEDMDAQDILTTLQGIDGARPFEIVLREPRD